MDRPLLILSDAHLSKKYGDEVGTALSQLFLSYPDCEVVLAGDIFDLSLDGPDIRAEESLDAALTRHPKTVDALRSLVQRGQKLTIVPGNHDAGLHHSGMVERLHQHLSPPNDNCVEVTPWFIRRDGVHIEHGHLYDPDCAPNHPLAPHNPRSEGLGTALMRRFISPHDALVFAHANQTTPAAALFAAFEKWGKRAPLIIADYFATAAKLCIEAARHKDLVAAEKTEAGARITAYAKDAEIHSQVIEALLRLAPQPTHHSLRSTFLRLYFDRIFSSVSLGAGLGMLSMAGLGVATGSALLTPIGALTQMGVLLSALGGGYLAGSTAIQKNRYGDRVIGQLGEAAHAVRAITQSDLVIFGHTHVEVDEPGYINLGSFGYGGRGRPYVLVDRSGKPQRKHLPAAAQL